jgi:hypothetical protein
MAAKKNDNPIFVNLDIASGLSRDQWFYSCRLTEDGSPESVMSSQSIMFSYSERLGKSLQSASAEFELDFLPHFH